MKYTESMLEKMEKIVEESGYIVRYERGHFQSGYCILEHRKVVVLNKFLQTEGRISTLFDIIPKLMLNHESVSPEIRKSFEDLMLKYA
jgi:hypothetical protein